MSALPESRESLSYWEHRLRSLPRSALRQRREARTMAARWRVRVEEAERAQYGAGLLGVAFMLYAERRLPASARHGARQVVRVGKAAAIAFVVFVIALAVIAGAVAIEVLRALL